MGPMYREDKINEGKCPPSILRKRSLVSRVVGDKDKAERRVRFRNPVAITVHDISCCNYMIVHERSSKRLPMLLLTVCILLILAGAMYCTNKKHYSTVLDILKRQLAGLLLHIRQFVRNSRTWLMKK
ncbi:nutritionally-regulated adipose and cardiac enriched protein homolog [Lissotriton helveticus]